MDQSFNIRSVIQGHPIPNAKALHPLGVVAFTRDLV